MSTQAIITNWKRAENVDGIIDALLEQSVPFDKIVIVDNSPNAYPYRYWQGYRDLPERTDIWRFPDNGIGPPCRFMPALLDYRYDCCMFLDDDFLPGKQMHEFLLQQAAALNNEFSTIGQIGRLLTAGQRYEVRDVTRRPGPRRVDITCRAHFVRREFVIHAMDLRDLILEIGMSPPVAGPDDWTRHDDILLCLGAQLFSGYPSYIIPTCEQEQKIIRSNLSDPDAMWRRPGHVASRQHLIDCAIKCDWRSLVHQT